MDNPRFRPPLPPIILSILAFMIGTFGCLASVVNAYHTAPFATEAWSIQTGTYCYFFNSADPTALYERIDDYIMRLDLEMQITWFSRDSCGLNTDIDIQISDTDLNDEVRLGHYVRSAIEMCETLNPYIPLHGTILRITFQTPDERNMVTWRFPYSQAVEAAEAGLEGRDMFIIGQ